MTSEGQAAIDHLYATTWGCPDAVTRSAPSAAIKRYRRGPARPTKGRASFHRAVKYLPCSRPLAGARARPAGRRPEGVPIYRREAADARA